YEPGGLPTVLPRINIHVPPERVELRQPACKAEALPLSYRGVRRDDTIRTCNLLVPNQVRFTNCATSRLARTEGLEPPAGDFGDRCSTSSATSASNRWRATNSLSSVWKTDVHPV